MAFYWALGYLTVLTHCKRTNYSVIIYKTNYDNNFKFGMTFWTLNSLLNRICNSHKKSVRRKCIGMGSCSLSYSNSVSAIKLHSTSERISITNILFSRRQSIYLTVMKFEFQTANTYAIFSILWNYILQRIRLPDLIFKKAQWVNVLYGY